MAAGAGVCADASMPLVCGGARAAAAAPGHRPSHRCRSRSRRQQRCCRRPRSGVVCAPVSWRTRGMGRNTCTSRRHPPSACAIANSAAAAADSWRRACGAVTAMHSAGDGCAEQPRASAGMAVNAEAGVTSCWLRKQGSALDPTDVCRCFPGMREFWPRSLTQLRMRLCEERGLQAAYGPCESDQSSHDLVHEQQRCYLVCLRT